MTDERRNPVSANLRAFARDQRSVPTRAEDLFWREVRAGRLNGHKFKRQVPIAPYVVDFLCPAARVVVELDGPPHEEAERRARDATREAWLTRQGFVVLRFTNDEFFGNPGLALSIVRRTVEGRSRGAGAARLPDGPSPCLASPSCPSPAEGGGERVEPVP
jgi:very-short-patch-repair endonuclease